MTRRDRLGRGLGALLGDYLETDSPTGDLKTVKLSAVVPNPHQPRRTFTESELSDLAASIKENGLLQPLVVRPAPGSPDRFELVAGERRYRALDRLGWEQAPVLIREATDETMLVLALVENLQREALSPLEEAEGYRVLADQFDLTQAQIADAVGKSRSTVANFLRLLNLPASVRKFLEEGGLSMGHARALLAVDDDVRAGALAREAVREGWSVRETERRVSNPDAAAKPRKQSVSRAVDPVVAALEQSLQERLATRVSIKPSSTGKGTIEITYLGDEDFERIFALVAGHSINAVLE